MRLNTKLFAVFISPILMAGTAMAHPTHGHLHHHRHGACHRMMPPPPPPILVLDAAQEQWTYTSPVKFKKHDKKHLVDILADKTHSTVSLPSLGDKSPNVNDAIFNGGVVFNNATPEQISKTLSTIVKGGTVKVETSYNAIAPVSSGGSGLYKTTGGYAWAADYSFGRVYVADVGSSDAGDYLAAGRVLTGSLNIRTNATLVRLVPAGHNKYNIALLTLSPVKVEVKLPSHPPEWGGPGPHGQHHHCCPPPPPPHGDAPPPPPHG